MENSEKGKVSKSKPSRTKLLARELGVLPAKRKALNKLEQRNAKKRKGQLLSYVIVIDFESTCWKDKRGGRPEIIEFPAVLLDLSGSKITSEFHHYVSPVEQPVLSSFCKELTGISQHQVDNGIPLPTCLYLFKKWVEQLKQEMGVVLMEPGLEYTEEDDLCALVTWSDWDLEVCLSNECSRKQIKKPTIFNQWIDIRGVYKTFYERKPAGLNGALEDLGIKFVGRQHSGIDDAKNTAKLCFRMVRDGCRLTITKCIQKQRSRIGPPPARPPLHDICNAAASSASSKQDSDDKPQNSLSSPSNAKAASGSSNKLNRDHRADGQATSSLQTPQSQRKPNASKSSHNDASSSEVTNEFRNGPASLYGCHESIPDESHAKNSGGTDVKSDDGEDCRHDWEELFGTELFEDFVSEMDVWEEDQSIMERAFSGRTSSSFSNLKERTGNMSSPLGASSLSLNLNEQAGKVSSHAAMSSNLKEQTAVGSSLVNASFTLGGRKNVLVQNKPLVNQGAPFVRSLAKGDLLSGCNTSSPTTIATTTSSGTAVLGSAAQLNHTPSRPQFVTHVTPLTLLPANAAGTLGLHHRGFYGADKEPLGSENRKASKLSSASLGSEVRERRSIDSHDGNVVTTVGETPPLNTEFQQRETLDHHMTHNTCNPVLCASPVTKQSPCRVEETPPLEQGSSNPPVPLVVTERALSSGENFRTPNSAQWLKLKNSFGLSNQSCPSWRGSSVSGSSSGVFPSGGKITPPLCGCGRRAKRKVVSTPGPNEGKPFYICPNSRGSDIDRKQGCNYFRWEFPTADCSNLARPLLSDYGE